MRWVGPCIALVALVAARPAFGQAETPSDTLAITADSAATWVEGDTNIIQATGHVTITTDDASMSADNAVVWLRPIPGGLVGQQLAEISLLGNAKIVHGQATRSNDQLYVNAAIRGRITFFGERFARNSNDTDIYREGLGLRPRQPGPSGTPANVPVPPIINQWLLEPPSTEPFAAPTTAPTTQPSPVYFEAHEAQQTIGTDGKVAYVLEGGVLITQSKRAKAFANVQANDQNEADVTDHVELRADRAVILTQLTSLRELSNAGQTKLPEDVVQGVYLEGDVRIVETSAASIGRPENRLDCERVYYEFTTDRAILTDAVLHTIEPRVQIPIIMRANIVRQLSQGEYRAKDAELTTSSFLVPSYSIRASTAYVRQVATGDPRYGNRTDYVAHNAFLDLFHVPVFYLPVTSGQMTDRGGALRNIEVGSSKNNGFGVRTEWGLFESLGVLPPPQLDAYYKADYFTDRGPAFGLNAKYEGGYITETTRQPWDFQGDFKSYFLPDDQGTDKLGKDRSHIGPDAPERDPFRGHFQWEHQHFFPEDWQVQLRLGLVSDPSFLEYWEEPTFNDGLPHDATAYVKHQRDTEAFTLLLQVQPNDMVTTADQLQETFPTATGANVGTSHPFEVERLPEIGYYRIGDSLADDSLTFFSANSLAALRFNETGPALTDYGFHSASSKTDRKLVLPGLPSIGQTGITDNRVYRGDFRQELDYPIQAGEFKMVPFVVGRLTSYSDSVDGSSLNRLIAAAGLRMTTAFWKVDDSAESDLFDIHRLRHVIEPEVNLFTSVANADRSDVFIYDEAVDSISDISAVQLALRQQWQTKRGGPGNWRSVDFLTFNLEANFFSNAPSGDDLPPGGFRGLYYTSVPEESIPRDSLNFDALWRASDTTVVLADLQQNLDQNTLATTSVGLAVQRDLRTQYFAGVRYIGDIDSTIASFLLNYQISTKYSMLLKYSFNFSENSSEEASFGVIRKFDRFFVTFEVFRDVIDDNSGFRFGILPEGLGGSVSSGQLQNLFGGSQ